MERNISSGTGRATVALGLLAVLALLLAAVIPSGAAGSGGVSPSAGSKPAKNKKANRGTPRKYHRLWNRIHKKQKRWASRVAECESGKNPKLTALNGRYRGAFMFTRHAWRTSPKSPGGDPIRFSYKTQAVVAIFLKKRDGTRPWPVCG